MKDPKERLDRWAKSLCKSVSVGSLISRCPIAHKWKAPYRVLVVREALFWRMADLGQQILLLTEHKHILGARILLRSAVETLALLIYQNQKIETVIAGQYSFFEFDAVSMQLLMGSKNKVTSHAAINTLTVLEKAEKTHPGILKLHESLSESAHPNYDGVLLSYSKTERGNYETTFLNRYIEIFGDQQEPATAFVFAVFEHEYNVECPRLLESLEEWLRKNDEVLEKYKSAI